jgi:hypothetical protein
MFVFYESLLFCQVLWNGHLGTYDDPYEGTVSTSVTWNPLNFLLPTDPNFDFDNTIWIGTINISSGATLTILPGGTVRERTRSKRLTINSGGILDIEAGSSIWIYHFTNNGILRLESNYSFDAVAQLYTEDWLGNGTTQIQLFVTGGSTNVGGVDYYKWHYVSVPVEDFVPTVFTDATFDFAQYIESNVVSNNNLTGWVNWLGYNYESGSYPGPSILTLKLGKGYDFWVEEDNTYTIAITGPVNVADVGATLTSGTSFPDYQGWNLLGNPFTMCINWDYLVSNQYLPPEMNNAIYFTFDDQFVSYVDGWGDPPGTTGIIPPLQGFFVKANSSTSDFVFPSLARINDLFQLNYKGSSKSNKSPGIRLKLENQTDSGGLVVMFNKKATTSVDKEYDAYKFSKTVSPVSIWTKINDVEYAINGLPFPETSVEVPVGIFVAASGTYKLSCNELHKMENYNVTLKDLSTNINVDLKKNGIQVFNTTAGMIEDRFVLTVTNIATGISDIIIPDKKFSIYSSAGTINIISLTEEFNNISGSVNIYDLYGRKLLRQSDVEWHGKGELKQIQFNSAKQGLYIVEIIAGNKKYVEKVNLRN